MANFTVVGNYTNKLNQTLSVSPAGIVEFFSALNTFLSITAALGNALILVALKNVFSINPPTKLCSRCLAVTNFCVGLIVQPLLIADIMSRVIKINLNILYYVYKSLGALSCIMCGVSVLTSTAISVDRLFARLLGVRYRHVVTLRRVCVVITCFWIMHASSGCIWVWRTDSVCH